MNIRYLNIGLQVGTFLTYDKWLTFKCLGHCIHVHHKHHPPFTQNVFTMFTCFSHQMNALESKNADFLADNISLWKTLSDLDVAHNTTLVALVVIL